LAVDVASMKFGVQRLAERLLDRSRMRRTWMIVASLCLGGCATSYRSASGRDYGPDDRALDEALRDSGSTNLACDPAKVRVRRIVTFKGYN
jgi:hypothetical protein